MDNKYLYDAKDSKSFCIFNWILSEDPKSKSWLLDTVSGSDVRGMCAGRREKKTRENRQGNEPESTPSDTVV